MTVFDHLYCEVIISKDNGDFFFLAFQACFSNSEDVLVEL